ncbi:MAG: hypothetical protein HZA90_26505 [Verrucomicrobia bacterium]|nr:hypothetical protein [Verrucomicrobiota bacterium]
MRSQSAIQEPFGRAGGFASRPRSNPARGNARPTRPLPHAAPPCRSQGFTLPDFLVVLAVLAVLVAVTVPIIANSKAKARQAQCFANLQQVTQAVLLYANDNHGVLPQLPPNSPNPTWWFYKEQVKGYVGLRGSSSPHDTVFACPDDRGYDAAGPFCRSKKFDYGSYNFNGVNLPWMPHVAGRQVSTIRDPARTLLVMEWTAHAPLSWHRSLTGKKNSPFYNNAENMVGFVDGRVKFIPIYYDGVNAAYTRDPIPGYEYKYSGD